MLWFNTTRKERCQEEKFHIQEFCKSTGMTLIKPWERGVWKVKSLKIGKEGKEEAFSHLAFGGKIKILESIPNRCHPAFAEAPARRTRLRQAGLRAGRPKSFPPAPLDLAFPWISIMGKERLTHP